MSLAVTLTFRDSRGRAKSRTIVHTSDVFATVVADLAVLMPLWNPLTDLAFESATISARDAASSFVGAAVSNVDENVSLQVLGDNGFNYDFNLPDVPDAKIPSETIDPADVDLVALIAKFGSGDVWRINPRSPVSIASIVSGTLDK